MPSLQDIREFNDSLVRLANEPDVVGEWGEEIEALPEPEEGLDNDLSSLLADTGDLASEASPYEPEPDLDDLISEEVSGEAEPAEPPLFEELEDEFAQAEAPGEEFADDLFGADFLPGEGAGEEGPGETGGESGTGEPSEDEWPSDELTLPEETAAEAPSAEEETQGAAEEVDFSDFEALLSEAPFGEEPEGAESGEIEPSEGFGEEPSPFDMGETEEESAEPEFPAWDEGLPEDEGGGEPEAFEEGAFALDEAFGGEEITGFDETGEPAAAEPGEEPEEFGIPDEGEGAEEFGAEAFEGFELGDETFSFDEVPDEEPGEEIPDETPEEPTEDDIFALPEGDEELSEPFGAETLDEGFDLGAEGGDEFSLPDESETDSELEGDLGAFEFSDEDLREGLSAESEESFSFDEPMVPGEEGEAGSAAPDEAAEEPAEELDDFGAGGIDEFSLGDFGAEFGVLMEEGPASEEELNPALDITDTGPGPISTGAGDFRISETAFEQFQSNLSSLPLNLKREVSNIITEAKGTTDQVEQLVRRLAAGESAIDIATFAGRIIGKQIRIPRGYEKRTGEEFEAERQSFAYQFRENILPILRMVGIAAVALVVLGLGAYHLVFRPLHSRSLYREGLGLIAEGQYALGNQTFVRAREVWANNKWFYEYAEGFIDQRQYTLAAEKYEQLLFGMSDLERDFYGSLLERREFGSIILERAPEKQGVLDYARLESEIVGNYERADLLLQLILYDHASDYDGWLAIGDNNMRWAEEDPSRYEDARLAYARLMERYGQTDTLLFRMLRYFVRTDNLQQVLVLRDTFEGESRLKVEAAPYTEMAGYLIDKGEIEGLEDVLFRVMSVDPFLPELHYQMARYYRVIGVPGSEEIALQRAVEYLSAADPLTRERRAMLVDAHTRVGENLYAVQRYIEAQESFGKAIETYEEGLRRRVLSPDAMFGRAYAGMADILYYVGRQYDDAIRYMNLAEQNGYTDPNLDYKEGFIHYRNAQLDTALAEFRSAAEDPSGTTNALLWATANTYYRRGNYFAAEAYYRELLERVELQRDNIRHLLVDEDERHQSVIEYLIRANNNLGVTLAQLNRITNDPDYFSSALVYLTESIEYSENYRRDPDTLMLSEAVNLAYLNQRGLLYPTPEYSLQIHTELPEDLDDLVF